MDTAANTYVIEMQFDASPREFEEAMPAVSDAVMVRDNAMIVSGIKEVVDA